MIKRDTNNLCPFIYGLDEKCLYPETDDCEDCVVYSGFCSASKIVIFEDFNDEHSPNRSRRLGE